MAISELKRMYAPLLVKARGRGSREARMKKAAELIWTSFGPQASAQEGDENQAAVSWVGFYLKVPGRDELVLGPCRDKPACSPIGLHGVCGRAWREQRPVVVRDVASLGEAYIACDPKDKSECVIPLFESDGSCWGVLDADSHEIGAFEEHDVNGMITLVERLGLSAPSASRPEAVVI